MNTSTLNPTAQAMNSQAAHAGPEVEERPAVQPTEPSEKPLHHLTEDPRYIGKSVDIRSRVMSHMRAEDEREMMSQTLQVEYIQTAGEIGALLLESHLIKSLNPIFNVRLRRLRKLCTLQIEAMGNGLMPVIVSGKD
jgi:hypothetical protein